MLLAFSSASKGLTPGAWETFSTEANADAWTVSGWYFDDSTSSWESDYFYPGWSDSLDPYIGYTMSWDSCYIYADDSVASGAFTGDYTASNVRAITMDIAVSDTSLIDYFDFSILSEVDGVSRYYYTDSYTVQDLENNVWNQFNIFIRPDLLRYADGSDVIHPWYYWDPNDGWVETTLSDTVLSNITEIGISFFHADESGSQVDVLIDNVALNHSFLWPDFALSVTVGMATMSFQPLPGTIYDLQKYNATTMTWEGVPGQTSILGPNPFTYSEPAVGTGLFRCSLEPYYTEVVTEP